VPMTARKRRVIVRLEVFMVESGNPL
jgi:hypothetical protein